MARDKRLTTEMGKEKNMMGTKTEMNEEVSRMKDSWDVG